MSLICKVEMNSDYIIKLEQNSFAIKSEDPVTALPRFEC